MAAMTYSTPSYGSGGMSWSDSGYDGCVQQCVASFGTPGTYYAPTAAVGEMGSSGTGVTHTVVVAPTQGVLRYVPFALNASVGDTVMFMWGANNHTVTKSSELTPCNKTSDAPFASGEQNKGFVFTQVVNDTNPTFFYCGTPNHCEQGMFGIINPPSALNAPTSVSGMMSAVMSNDTTGNIATYSNYTANMTAGSMSAASWGANIDMSSMPSWAYESVVENVMFTRNVLAMNPDMMNADGSVSLASLGSNPMMVPADVGQALAAASSTPSSSAGSSSASTSAAPSSSQSATGATSNGAMSVASSKVLVGATVLVATFFAL
jgi:plastocyanin